MSKQVEETDADTLEGYYAVEKSSKSQPSDMVVEICGGQKVVQVSLTPSEQNRNHRVRQHLQDRRVKKASKKALLSGSDEFTTPLQGVNLRDVGAVTQGPMSSRKVFRSSELLSKEEMQIHQIKTILDLRRMDRPCKKGSGSKAVESTRTLLKYLLLGPNKLVPEKRLMLVHRAHPHNCELCEARAKKRYDADLHLVHADLIPSTVGLRIFQAMPMRVQAKAILMALVGKGAASVMAPAVANPLLLGYKALYKTLLEDSKRSMALALRVFADADNFPVLVHCIHGKDRTGILIMLLLMLCSVPSEAIVDDYVLSETVLKESRLHHELNLDVYLTSDDVIAASRDTMDETIAYICEKYGNAAGYMSEVGLEDWEIESIRRNLMKAECLSTSDTPPPPPLKSRFSLQGIFPFTKRFSAPVKSEPSHQKFLRRSSLPAKTRTSSIVEASGLPTSKSMPRTQETIEKAQPFTRRASLANSGAAEIRAVLKQLREQHPELNTVEEVSPDGSLSKVQGSSNASQLAPNQEEDPMKDPVEVKICKS